MIVQAGEYKEMVRKGLAGGSYKPLTEESMLKVHQTAMRIIEEIGFEPNRIAQILTGKKTKTIGVLLENTQLNFNLIILEIST